MKTGIDGIMIDWLFHGPIHPGERLKWLPCEQQMWKELMGTDFPGKDKVTRDQETEFARRSVVRCWDRIRSAAKSADPDCIIWLSCYDLEHPQVKGTKIFREVDWLMNEAGDIASVKKVKHDIGPSTQLITCLANWNNADPTKIVPAARELGVGLYGFTKPTENSLLPSMDKYLSKPIDAFEGDAKNIATLVRAYKDLSLEYLEQ